jgi:WD40 repeat protein
MALSGDSKYIVVGDKAGTIRLFQTKDFSIQRCLTTGGEYSSNPVLSAAFDPTCPRVVAFGYLGGSVELYMIRHK